ncbi:hypothetical protein [Heterosigma akashiwo virus 01]|jgi:hypothetical protein|uniref:Uncharacterized protein n=1 Tax=Heterosigma akashiwo virus 01 TaxID=97195 RepID=A0A1C9C510_HAV01|nr:hypothetical protein D1R72_gp042 [Heterosigma akashiwo virus 01]AOM63373.1 hypothetical protein [Heterosigma akashiwo virus 01]
MAELFSQLEKFLISSFHGGGGLSMAIFLVSLYGINYLLKNVSLTNMRKKLILSAAVAYVIVYLTFGIFVRPLGFEFLYSPPSTGRVYEANYSTWWLIAYVALFVGIAAAFYYYSKILTNYDINGTDIISTFGQEMDFEDEDEDMMYEEEFKNTGRHRRGNNASKKRNITERFGGLGLLKDGEDEESFKSLGKVSNFFQKLK